MTLTYYKAEPVSLGRVGLDEKWLKERILEDPLILDLGELSVLRQERRQPTSGGRIDFLMSDPETGTMYEVEVMLGRLDESHIIRTIEYWDLERRRYPDRDHVAVIVAEEITNRFFNVIGLLNRSVPIMAVQLNAFRVDDKIVLNFTKVLDLYEQGGDYEDEEAEQTDRSWWEHRSDPESLGILDSCVKLLSADGRSPRVTYNNRYIVMGGRRQNFAWFFPRRQRIHCFVEVKVAESDVEELLSALEEAGLTVDLRRPGTIRLKVTPREIREQQDMVRRLLVKGSEDVGGGL